MASTRIRAELQALREVAQPVCDELGLSWEVCLAQAWAESGLGRSELAQRANNFHGIKYRAKLHDAFVWHISPERTRKGITTRKRMQFASFETPEDGIRGWAQKLLTKRYAGCQEFQDDPVRTMAFLWGKGWATANHYVEAFTGRLRKLGEAIGDDVLAEARVDHELEPCLELLRELYGKERHQTTEALAAFRFCWSRVPELSLDA